MVHGQWKCKRNKRRTPTVLCDMVDYRTHKMPWIATAFLLVGLSACSRESIQEFFANYTPRERYEQSLLDAGP